MADVTKLVAKDTEPGQRYQVFTDSDVNAGDIIRVKASLRGRPASKVSIVNGAAVLEVKFNVYKTVYPSRKLGEGFSDLGLPNISLGVDFVDSGNASTYALAANETLDLDNDFTVNDIYVTTATDTFKIIVS